MSALAPAPAAAAPGEVPFALAAISLVDIFFGGMTSVNNGALNFLVNFILILRLSLDDRIFGCCHVNDTLKLLDDDPCHDHRFLGYVDESSGFAWQLVAFDPDGGIGRREQLLDHHEKILALCHVKGARQWHPLWLTLLRLLLYHFI